MSDKQRELPTRTELSELNKKQLVNELWGEIQTNIELNAQLRATMAERDAGQTER